MTAAKEQEASGNAGAVDSSVTATFPGATTADNLLLAVLSYRGTSTQHADPAGWTRQCDVQGPSFDGGRMILLWKIADGTETTVTVGCSSSKKSLYIAEWSELGAFDAEAETDNHAANQDMETSSLAPGESSVVLFAGFNASTKNTGANHTWHAPFTRDYFRIVDNSGPVVSFGHQVVPAVSGSYQATARNNISGDGYGAFIASFAAAAPPSVVADFSGTPLSGNAPLEVAFTDESTGGPSSWDWDFGDGDTSTSQNPTHIYTDPGVYTVTLTIDGGDSTITRTNYITVTTPGGVIGDPGDFVSLPASDIVNWKITRSGPPAGTGGGYTGAGTIRLNNTDDRYNPENEASDIIDKLRDGTRIWIGINEDGTITPDEAKTVHGLFGGRITEITVLPSPGSDKPSQVEFVCEDPASWIDRTAVTIPASRHRSQLDLRTEILVAAGETVYDLEVEPTTMPLSYADGQAGNLLDDLNRANGTRHYARPADDPETWYHYVTVRRTSKLSGVADASIDAGTQHLTDTSGWKTSAESVINQQRATVEPAFFTSYQTPVWETDDVPFAADSRPEIWVEFDDYVERPVVLLNFTGSTVTASIEDFGTTAKITLTGTGTVTSLQVQGSLTRRGVAESVLIDDDTSQDATRGVRAGSDISGDMLGTIRGAHAIASHVVWRYAAPLYSPEFVVENWFPTMFTLDLYDTIAVTTDHIGVEARIFEIIGITHEGNLAAENAQHHVVRYQTIESRVQSPKDWFTLDESELDGTHVLAY